MFVGSPRAQATPELLHWPQLIAVTDLASAQAAVEEISEQGEGALTEAEGGDDQQEDEGPVARSGQPS